MGWSRGLFGLAAVAAAALGGGCIQEPSTAVALYDNCVSCHGADGAGSVAVGAPAIAGLPQWYIESQLGKFKSGARAYHGDDVNGLKMRPMAMSLVSDEEVKTVAAYVAALPPVQTQDTLEGANVAAGQERYKLCASCHGAEGKGNEAVKAPPLTGSSDWYLVTQLQHYKAGVRGAHQGDTTGATMRAIMGTLPDDQAIKDVVAYIQTLPE